MGQRHSRPATTRFSYCAEESQPHKGPGVGEPQLTLAVGEPLRTSSRFSLGHASSRPSFKILEVWQHDLATIDQSGGSKEALLNL